MIDAKGIAVALLAVGLIAGTGLGVRAIYKAGEGAGMAAIQADFDRYKAEQAQALAEAVEETRRLETGMADRTAQIRVEYQEYANEAEKRAAAAVRDVDLDRHRLRRAFNTCANSINVLADSEGAARAAAEGLD